MSEWPKNIDRHWFVIARSPAVTSQPHRVTLFGRRWALARDRENKVLVLEDRCPHRHAPPVGRGDDGRWPALPLSRLDVQSQRRLREDSGLARRRRDA